MFLRKSTQDQEEKNTEDVKNNEPSYWTLSQQNQVVESKTIVGIGLKEMKRNIINITKLSVDPHLLVDKVGEEVTKRHLNKLISAQLVLKPIKIKEHIIGKGLMKKEVMSNHLLYFLENRIVKWMDMDTQL